MLDLRAATLLALLLAVGCGDNSPTGGEAPAPASRPLGPDVTSPYPIDRGDAGVTTPGSYKGLWLRLLDRPGPAITPVDGVIGIVCVGMSNGNQECGSLITQLAGPWRGEAASTIRVVNCAVGGHAIERWNDPDFDAVLWDDCINRKLALAGVRPDQVLVLYHKAANQFSTGPGGVPLPLYPGAGSDYEAFTANLDAFSARVRGKFPAVRAVYSSSRSYGGFGSGARGEPLSYEEGHALNSWLATHATVDGVWYGWGAYLWAPDCATGVTNASGVCYDRSDYQADAVHPSDVGRLKIARMMHDRLRREAWYRP